MCYNVIVVRKFFNPRAYLSFHVSRESLFNNLACPASTGPCRRRRDSWQHESLSIRLYYMTSQAVSATVKPSAVWITRWATTSALLGRVTPRQIHNKTVGIGILNHVASSKCSYAIVTEQYRPVKSGKASPHDRRRFLLFRCIYTCIVDTIMISGSCGSQETTRDLTNRTPLGA